MAGWLNRTASSVAALADFEITKKQEAAAAISASVFSRLGPHTAYLKLLPPVQRSVIQQGPEKMTNLNLAIIDFSMHLNCLLFGRG
jgi:hypothetical protein